MATILGVNCSKSKLNLGIEPCEVQQSSKTGHILVPKGWRLELATETLNKAYVLDQIQRGVWQPVLDAFDVVSTNAEDVKEESSLGVMSVARKGKTTVVTTLKKQFSFHKAIYSKQGSDEYDVIEVFDNGSLKFALTKDGLYLKGLDTGMYNVPTYVEATGTTSASTLVEYQLTDVEEINTQSILAYNFDFNVKTDLTNIVDAKLTGISSVAAGNDVKLAVTWLHNDLYNILGLQSANFKLFVNDVEDVIVSVAYDTLSNKYTIVPTATLVAADVVKLVLHDATATPVVDVAKLGSKYYSGTGTVTVTA